MQINVAQLLKEPIGETRNYKVNEVVDVISDSSGNAVWGEVKLLRTHRGILVQGVLRTEVTINCGRCLSPIDYPLTLNINDEYIPTVDIVTGTPLPLPEEPSSFTIDEHHIIDLTEAIRQYMLLAIPLKPICRDDCVGLCQSCGQNLNQGPCDCPLQAVDPRWSALEKLL